jgi:hypothetical protein
MNKVSLSLVPREVLKVLSNLIDHGYESYIARWLMRRNPQMHSVF